METGRKALPKPTHVTRALAMVDERQGRVTYRDDLVVGSGGNWLEALADNSGARLLELREAWLEGVSQSLEKIVEAARKEVKDDPESIQRLLRIERKLEELNEILDRLSANK